MQLNSQKSGSSSLYSILLLLLLVVKKRLLVVGRLRLWPEATQAHPLKPAHLPLHCQPTSSLEKEIKMNHQLTHSLAQNVISARRYKDNHQITGKTGNRSIPSKRGKDILSAITAKRAFDKYPMPSKRYNHIKLTITAKRAFRGMAGLAVLYPSVVDYMDLRLKTPSRCLLGDLRGYSVNLCR